MLERWHGLKTTDRTPHANAAGRASTAEASKARPNAARSSPTLRRSERQAVRLPPGEDVLTGHEAHVAAQLHPVGPVEDLRGDAADVEVLRCLARVLELVDVDELDLQAPGEVGAQAIQDRRHRLAGGARGRPDVDETRELRTRRRRGLGAGRGGAGGLPRARR